MRFTTNSLALALAGCAAIGLAAPAVAQDTPPAPPAEQPAPAPETEQPAPPPAPEAEQPQPGHGDHAQPQPGDQPADDGEEPESPEA